ncbi:MAG: ferritin-like domain-containing protein, partial [Cyclobacteriaceae bacterium]
IRVFGQTPISTLKEYLENSEIKESKSDLTGFQMVNKVLEDFRTLLDILHECIESAEEIGDVGTEIMAKSYVKQIEKDHWILTTWLK